MAGNKAGGKKAAKKNLEKDPDFYKKIGAIGGKQSRGGGFAYDKELARKAGSKGGKKSKRSSKNRTKIIALFQVGTPAQEIADLLGISIHTVYRHTRK